MKRFLSTGVDRNTQDPQPEYSARVRISPSVRLSTRYRALIGEICQSQSLVFSPTFEVGAPLNRQGSRGGGYPYISIVPAGWLFRHSRACLAAALPPDVSRSATGARLLPVSSSGSLRSIFPVSSSPSCIRSDVVRPGPGGMPATAGGGWFPIALYGWPGLPVIQMSAAFRGMLSQAGRGPPFLSIARFSPQNERDTRKKYVVIRIDAGERSGVESSRVQRLDGRSSFVSRRIGCTVMTRWRRLVDGAQNHSSA